MQSVEADPINHTLTRSCRAAGVMIGLPTAILRVGGSRPSAAAAGGGGAAAVLAARMLATVRAILRLGEPPA
jgi:hypothetical protein